MSYCGVLVLTTTVVASGASTEATLSKYDLRIPASVSRLMVLAAAAVAFSPLLKLM